MLKQMAKHLAGVLGYEIRRRSPDVDHSAGFSLVRYLRPDGSFDYERYRRLQIEGNQRKLRFVWASEENIAFAAAYITKLIGVPRFGICHGTRRGEEQRWFRQYLGCEVIGTEISDTATQFPDTIQWDFHETKPEWLEAADFVYSNAFDHSYDPKLCLDAWMSCVRKGGLCIIEHSSAHGPSGVSPVDPFGADIVQMPYLIAIWGRGRYGVRELIPTPRKHESVSYQYFIVIQKY